MPKKNKGILIFCLLIATIVEAQEFQTYTYYSNDSISLNLDLFLPHTETFLNTPLLIFVHGGGFSIGDRTDGHNLARFLIMHDIACATISYTLYMKDKSFSCDGILSEKIKAIQIAASQLWCATAYLIGQNCQIHIDTTRIFLAGSSAGAETVLHAAFWNREQMQLYKQTLSKEFKYAGLIAGAGAIMDLNLITTNNKIPLMAFHGDADPLVPYSIAPHHHCPPNSSGWLMLFGSYSIAQHLQNINGTCQLITFKGGDHSCANEYISTGHQPIVDFINKVLAGEKFILYQTIE